MNLVIFDTEFTAWAGSQERNWSEAWEHREIIQWAAVKVRMTENGADILESFNELIVPSKNPLLSDYIVQLTGIHQSMIDNMGVDFESALKQFHQFCEGGALPCFAWGEDVGVVRENCILTDSEFPDFKQGFVDFSRLARSLSLPGSEVSSGELATTLGLDLKGQNHNALFDVRSITYALDYWMRKKYLTLPALADSVEDARTRWRC